jgi:hypothetical protein
MKSKSKYEKYLNQVHKVKMQLKQACSKYYGQINKELKGTLTKQPEFGKVHQEKDVLTLRKLLDNINFKQETNQDSVTGRQGLR